MEKVCYSICCSDYESLRRGMSRSMASILEIAALNELLKMSGHHPAREFFDRLEGTLLGQESEVPRPVAPRRRPRGMATPPESSVGLPFPPSSSEER